MGGYLRQSTATQTRTIGPFVDDTDFLTAETALTIANTDVKLSANGGTVANKNSGGGTHVSNGHYALTFDATDTATVGALLVSVKVAGAAQVWDNFTVLEESVYDALFAASAAGPLDAAGVRSAVGLASADLDTQLSTIDANVDSVLADTGELQTDLADGGRVDLILDGIAEDTTAILVDTAEIGAAGAGLTAVPWNAAWDAEVQSECADALTAHGAFSANLTQILGDALAETSAGYLSAAFEFFFDVATPSKTVNDVGVAGAGLTAEDVWTYATRVLTANTNLNDPTAATIASQVRTELATELGRIDVATSSRLAASGAPANFAALGINVSGHLSRVTLVDTTTANSDMRGTDGASTHSAANVVSALKADAEWLSLTEDAGNAAIDAAAAKAVTDKLDTALEADGAAGWQFTTLALENAPAGGGGGGDATAANQTTIIGMLGDIQGAGFISANDSLEAIRNRGDAAWLTATGFAVPGSEMTLSDGAITAAKIGAGALDDKGNWNVGKTGYSLTQSFPANFAALGINASGHVSRVTLVDTVTANSDMRGTDGANTTVPPSAASVAAAVLAAGDVDGFTLEETLKLCLAALAGKISGATTTTITFRAADDSKDRMVATVDGDGNRTAVTLDAVG